MIRTAGGIPRIYNLSVDTTGTKVGFRVDHPDGDFTFKSNHISVSNEGEERIRVYFTKANFDADSGLEATGPFIRLAAADANGDGGGFYEGSDRLNAVWVRAEATTTLVRIVAREGPT